MEIYALNCKCVQSVLVYNKTGTILKRHVKRNMRENKDIAKKQKMLQKKFRPLGDKLCINRRQKWHRKMRNSVEMKKLTRS